VDRIYAHISYKEASYSKKSFRAMKIGKTPSKSPG